MSKVKITREQMTMEYIFQKIEALKLPQTVELDVEILVQFAYLIGKFEVEGRR